MEITCFVNFFDEIRHSLRTDRFELNIYVSIFVSPYLTCIDRDDYDGLVFEKVATYIQLTPCSYLFNQHM